MKDEVGETSDLSFESFTDDSPDNDMPRSSSKNQSHPLYDSHASHFFVDYKSAFLTLLVLLFPIVIKVIEIITVLQC